MLFSISNVLFHWLKVFADIQDACRAATRLEEIALGKSILSSVDYINRLIDSERRSNRPNKENRFEHFWTVSSSEGVHLYSQIKTDMALVNEYLIF